MNAPAEPARPPAALPEVGDVIGGKLRLDRVLGEGGMGVVFAATHEVLKRSVAVKVMRPGVTSNPSWSERFLREARVLVDLESPHTTRVLDADLHEGRVPYIVMEMLAGEDLAARVRREGAVAPSLAIRWALEACDALHEAHQAGVVHRDLKPSNLFVQKRKDRETIKLLDFGIAKRIVKNGADLDLTESGTTMGSPRFAAPEQLHDARTADERTDVWGFGVTFYEVLAGRQAFAGDSLAIVVAQIMAGSPDYAALPRDLAKIIERCTQREKAERYQSIVELAADLLELVPHAERPMLEIIRVVGEGARPSKSAASSSPSAPTPVPPPSASTAKADGSGSDPRLTPSVGATPPTSGPLDLSLSPVSSGARAPQSPAASRSLRPSSPTEAGRGGSERAATAIAAVAAVVCAVVFVFWFSRPSGEPAAAQPDPRAGDSAAPSATPPAPAAVTAEPIASALASAAPAIDVSPSLSASAPTSTAPPPLSRPKPAPRPAGEPPRLPLPTTGRSPYADQH